MTWQFDPIKEVRIADGCVKPNGKSNCVFCSRREGYFKYENSSWVPPSFVCVLTSIYEDHPQPQSLIWRKIDIKKVRRNKFQAPGWCPLRKGIVVVLKK